MADPTPVPGPTARTTTDTTTTTTRTTRSTNPIFARSGRLPSIQQRMAALAVSVRVRPAGVARPPPDQRAQAAVATLEDAPQNDILNLDNTVIDLSETLEEADESDAEDDSSTEPEEEDERSPLPATPRQAGPLDATIDLTDSPPPPPLSPDSPHTGPLSAIHCPVCLDSLSAVRRRGRTIQSTICGHVFCSTCLPRALATTGRCPACRTRLGASSYHNLYLA